MDEWEASFFVWVQTNTTERIPLVFDLFRVMVSVSALHLISVRKLRFSLNIPTI